MDAKFKNKIVSALRRLSRQWPPASEAKKLRKVGPATFECELCKAYAYEGSKSLTQLQKTPEFIPIFNKCISKGIEFKLSKTAIDHKLPVVPVTGFKGGWNWHEFVTNLYCDRSNYQILCKECHTKKSSYERKLRSASKVK